MKDQLVNIVQNILNTVDDPLYKGEIIIKNDSLLRQKSESDIENKLVKKAVDIVLKEKSLGSVKRLLDHLIQSGQLDEAINIVRPYLLFLKNPNPGKNIIQRTSYCTKILKKSKEIHDIEKTIRFATNLFVYCQRDSMFSSENFVQFVFEVIKLKPLVKNRDQKEKLSELVTNMIKTGLINEALNLTLMQHLHDAKKYDEIELLIRESDFDLESFSDLLRICRYAEEGKFDDALNLLIMYLSNDHISHISKINYKTSSGNHSSESLIHLLCHLGYFAKAMKAVSDSDSEDAKESNEILDSFLHKHLESIVELDPYDYSDNIELVAKLIGMIVVDYTEVAPKKGQEILNRIVNNVVENEFFQFLYHLYDCIGSSEEAEKWFAKAKSNYDYKHEDSDLLGKHAVANELLEYLFKRKEYVESCNVLIDYEKHVLPEIITEDDENLPYKDMYGFFGTDDYFFHETLLNIVQTERNAENIISQFKDSRIRDIGYIHLSAKAIQDKNLSLAFSYIKKLQAAPNGFAIVMLIDDFIEYCKTSNQFAEFENYLHTNFPNESVTWLDGV